MADPKPKTRRGCLFYLCLVGVISLVMLVVGAIFGLHYAKGLVGKLTDAQPMELPTVQLPEMRMFELHDRVATFQDNVRDGDPTEPLRLSADELNALIATDPSLAMLKKHLFVTINSNQFGAEISFPAEDVGLVRLRGRFINATGTFDISIRTNELQITANSLIVKGQPLPRHIMREVQAVNLAERFNEDPRGSVALRKLKSIEVKDGKLVIEAKPQ